MSEIWNFIIKILFQIGLYGRFILIFCSMYLLWDNNNLFIYYLYGKFIDLLLNLFLKGIFKQPRPLEDPELFNTALKHSERFKFINGYPYDIFGMPSGYAETTFYSTVFIYLALKNTKITLFYLLISLLTIYQRVNTKEHSFLQVIVGGIVGSIFGFFIYYIATKKITGKIRPKKDDNGPS